MSTPNDRDGMMNPYSAGQGVKMPVIHFGDRVVDDPFSTNPGASVGGGNAAVCLSNSIRGITSIAGLGMPSIVDRDSNHNVNAAGAQHHLKSPGGRENTGATFNPESSNFSPRTSPLAQQKQTTPLAVRGGMNHEADHATPAIIGNYGSNSYPAMSTFTSPADFVPGSDSLPGLSPTNDDLSPGSALNRAGRMSAATSPWTSSSYSNRGRYMSPLQTKGKVEDSSPMPKNQDEHHATPSKEPRGLYNDDTSHNLGGIEGQLNGQHIPTETSLVQGISRCLAIGPREGVYLDMSIVYQRLQQLSNGMPSNTLKLQMQDDKVYARFDDIKTALRLRPDIFGIDPSLKIDFISPKSYTSTGNTIVNLSTAHEGQVNVVAHANVPINDGWKSGENIIKSLLHSQGDIFAFVRLSGRMDGVFRAIVEFSSVAASLNAVSSLDKVTYQGFHLNLSLNRPDLAIVTMATGNDYLDASKASFTEHNQKPDIGLNNFEDVKAAIQDMARMRSQGQYPMTPAMQYSPSPVPLGIPGTIYYPQGPHLAYRAPSPSPGALSLPTQVSMPLQVIRPPYAPTLLSQYGGDAYLGGSLHGRLGDPISRTLGVRQDKNRLANGRGTRLRESERNNNIVDVNRIKAGADVRTTIMLRNIPNKVDQRMLKAIVDESSSGKYDFMYLRIDFQNDCNVGYAFINFVDPLDIIDFVNARGNQRWYAFALTSKDPLLTLNRNCFKSDKVAEVSYATIQGKDCLVQKFRNSSVMLEQPAYRPKLYYTINGPHPELAGQEEPFPGPDNQSKMKRSVENAEHVGLFTPNAGQSLREEQRRRRSNFDRGTRLAEMEELDYQQSQQMNDAFRMV